MDDCDGYILIKPFLPYKIASIDFELYKWKPYHTLDCQIELNSKIVDKEIKHTYRLLVSNIEKNELVEIQTGDFTIDLFYSHFAKITNSPKIGRRDIVLEECLIKNPEKIKVEQFNYCIVECVYVSSLSIWKILCRRTDKTMPNNWKTFKLTQKNIQENIPFSTILNSL